MPRRSFNRKRRSPKPQRLNLNFNRSVVVPFRDITTIQRTAGAGYEVSTINIAISSFAAGSRVRVLGSLYEFFRLKRLRVRAINDSQGMAQQISGSNYFVGLAHGVGFIPSASADFSSPSNFTDLAQFPNFKMNPSQLPVSIQMASGGLYGSTPVKWYHTSSTGTPPTADSSAGTIVYATRSATAQGGQTTYSYVEVDGLLEFRSPVQGGASFTGGLESKDEVYTSDRFTAPDVGDAEILLCRSRPNSPTMSLSRGAQGLRNDYVTIDEQDLHRPRLISSQQLVVGTPAGNNSRLPR